MDIPLPLPLLIGGAEEDGNDGARENTRLPGRTEKLSRLQRSWAAAGCGAVAAPTFRGNRFRLPRRDGEEDVGGYNRTLVELTRRSVGERVLVAGGIGPAGQELEPFGDVSFEELVTAYAEQAAALEEAGVDLFLLAEDMTMAEERAAMLAVRQASGKPVVVLARCDEEGRTASGTDVLAALIVMQGMGAAAFGLNGTVISAGEEDLTARLERGEIIVASMLPGDFTTSGHFILIVKSEALGFRVYDPNSMALSRQYWTYDTLAPQIAQLWSLTAA